MTFNTELWNGQAPGAGGYAIERSLRFNSSDSAYLSRTPASAGNRRTWTWAGWVKRSGLGRYAVFSSGSNINASFAFEFDSSDRLWIYNYTSGFDWQLTTASVYRDPSAWYHIVISVDTTQGTSADRVRVYVNGVQVTAFSTATYPSPSTDTYVNTAALHTLGCYQNLTLFSDSYLADVHFIDGQTPGTDTDDANGSVTGIPNAEYLTDFGEFDANGIWQPKEFTPPATPNNGTTWSSYGSLSASPPTLSGTIADIFDGSIVQAGGSFSINQANAGVTITFSPALPAGTTVKLLGDVYGTAGSNDYLQVNGTGYAQSLPASTGTTTFTALSVPAGASGISSIYLYREGTSTFNYALMGIEVDGVLLIDGDTSNIGVNGFHLPFDDNSSAATLGTDTSGNGNDWTVNNISVISGNGSYASDLTGNQTFAYPPLNAFNGVQPANGGDSANLAQLQNNSGIITFAPSVSIPVSSTVGCWVGLGGYIQFNGQTSSTAGAGGAVVTITVPSATSISSSNTLVIKNTTYATSVGTVVVDGVMLIDNAAPLTAGNDSLVDVPTNGTETDTGLGGEVRGNYCTLNPLFGDAVAIKNGNLDYDGTVDASLTGTRATFSVGSGKWYYEVTLTSPRAFTAGWAASSDQDAAPSVRYGIVCRATNNDYRIVTDATFYDPGDTGSANDVIGVAFDADQEKAWFAINGVWKGSTSQDPATDTGGYTGSTMTGPYTPYVTRDSRTHNPEGSTNFGQRPFAYTAPSGFKALNTANLDAPLVTKPSEYMDVLTWSGTNGNRSLSGLDMSPDFVWIKQRNQSYSVGHQLYDIVRGAGSLKQLDSSNTTAEGGGNTDDYGYLSSFDSTGFSVTTGSLGEDYVNKSGNNYVAWTWDAGSSTVTNTDGSITGGAQVRANATAGFSIVTYTGVGSTSSTVGHGLGVAPSFIITKARTTASQVNSWRCYHRSLGATQYIELSSTAAAGTFTDWANTAPTSSVFYVGGTNTTFPANENGINYVAYAFAPVAGYSSFGSYTGNGSTDGPFVYTGFRPRWIMYKRTDSTADWELKDTARDAYNLTDETLIPNTSGAAYTGYGLDILSNGFKPRTSGNAINNSGATYIYAAFAESPFQYARAR